MINVPDDDTRRSVSARIEAQVLDEATMVLSIAAAGHYDRVEEELTATLDGRSLAIDVIVGSHESRLHCVRNVSPGRLRVDHRAVVTGSAPPLPASDFDWIRYMRPSRYCESDRLGPFARSEFAGLEGAGLIAAVSSWVGANISYVPGSSRPIDGAVATLLAREGVCRDFAHLTAALLRANDIAARIVAVYAPGLSPMDFHAVTEACVDGVWYVVDPTSLAPRGSLVRIATGADAADIAFMTMVGGAIELADIEVSAIVDPVLPNDDHTELMQLR